ncbi:MAG: hypothetical protein ACI4DP_03705 [Candidatus Ornithomonoglobus sp.]
MCQNELISISEITSEQETANTNHDTQKDNKPITSDENQENTMAVGENKKKIIIITLLSAITIMIIILCFVFINQYNNKKETETVMTKIEQLDMSGKYDRSLVNEINTSYEALSLNQQSNVLNYNDLIEYVNYHNSKYKYLTMAKTMIDECDSNIKYIKDLSGSSVIMIPSLLSGISNDAIENNYKYFYDNLSIGYSKNYLGEDQYTVATNIMMTYSSYKKIYDMIDNFEYNKLSFSLWLSTYESYAKDAKNALNTLLSEYS